MTIHDRISRGRPLRWVAGVLERSGDLVALGGGMIGIALIVGVVLVGLHQRQTSFRVMAPAEQGETSP
jgi:hypothetical protein